MGQGFFNIKLPGNSLWWWEDTVGEENQAGGGKALQGPFLGWRNSSAAVVSSWQHPPTMCTLKYNTHASFCRTPLQISRFWFCLLWHSQNGVCQTPPVGRPGPYTLLCNATSQGGTCGIEGSGLYVVSNDSLCSHHETKDFFSIWKVYLPLRSSRDMWFS